MENFKTAVLQGEWFQNLQESCDWEKVGKGRHAAILIKPFISGDSKQLLVPIVRTTTRYINPTQEFTSIHDELFLQIQKEISIDLKESKPNLMLEMYDKKCITMKEHTDQTLDLDEKCPIIIFSCYQKSPKNPRILEIQNKSTGKTFEIKLTQNLLVWFNLDTNATHVHKIVLRAPKIEELWIGATFRFSKTFVTFTKTDVASVPILSGSGKILTLATEEEQKMFCVAKGKENKLPKLYPYPSNWCFTLSPSDLLGIVTKQDTDKDKDKDKSDNYKIGCIKSPILKLISKSSS
jgi:hypothetical protein